MPVDVAVLMTEKSRPYKGSLARIGLGLMLGALLCLLVPGAKAEEKGAIEVSYSGEVQHEHQVFAQGVRLFAVTQGIPKPSAWLPGAALMLEGQAVRQQERQLQGALLFDLSQSSQLPPRTLAAWLKAQPVTGRVQLSTLDPDQLEIMTDLNLPLGSAAHLHYPVRPAWVQVLTASGEWNRVPFHPALTVADYLQPDRHGDQRLDWVWVIQPNGAALRVGVAAWNSYGEGKRYPWPGGWIVPEYPWGLSAPFYADFARWLGSRVLP